MTTRGAAKVGDPFSTFILENSDVPLELPVSYESCGALCWLEAANALTEFSIAMWEGILAGGSPLTAEILASSEMRYQFLERAVAAVHEGMFSKALSLQLVEFVRIHAVEFFVSSTDSDTRPLRAIYDALLRHLVLPSSRSSGAADLLRETALRALNEVLIAVDAPRLDSALLESHVKTLYSLLAQGISSKNVAPHDWPKAAFECLKALEAAFPMLLAAQVPALLQLGAKEAATLCTTRFAMQLASAVLTSVCGTYCAQQEDENKEESGTAYTIFGAPKPADGTEPATVGLALVRTIHHEAPGAELAALRRAAVAACLQADSDGNSNGNGSSNRSSPTAVSRVASSTPTRQTSLCSMLAEDLEGGVPLLGQHTGGSTLKSICTALTAFSVPQHIKKPAAAAAPRLALTADAAKALQAAALRFLGAMGPCNDPRLNAAMADGLLCLLRVSCPSPALFTMHFQYMLEYAPAAMLRQLLGLCNEVPAAFEFSGVAKQLVALMNDAFLPPDRRMVAAGWLLKFVVQEERTAKEASLHYFHGAWEALLPRSAAEPLQLVVLKVQTLAACLAAGVGDPEVVCRAVCDWEGFAETAEVAETAKKAFGRALGSLLVAANPETNPKAAYMRACLAYATIKAVVERPALVPAVAAFLESCHEEGFVAMLMEGINALMMGASKGEFAALKQPAEAKKSGPSPVGAAAAAAKSAGGKAAGTLASLAGGFAKLFSRQRTYTVETTSPLNKERAAAYKSNGAPAARAVPEDLVDHGEAATWLCAASTWEGIAAGVLQHDLMHFRPLMLRALSMEGVGRRGTLRALHHYAQQYTGPLPGHALDTKEAVSTAILGLCCAAAAGSLQPLQEGQWWLRSQHHVSRRTANILETLALDFYASPGLERFALRQRCEAVAKLLKEEAWLVEEKREATVKVLRTGVAAAAFVGL